MEDSTSGRSRRKSKQPANPQGRRKKYRKHAHDKEIKDSILHGSDQLYPRLPPSDPSKVTKLQGQLQNNDLFPFTIEEGTDDEAFFASFNDAGDEGTHLRRIDREGFNDIMSCPSLAQRNASLPSETFEERAKKRGRDSAALQLALRMFCRNYEQHYGSLADQRLVDFPPALCPQVQESKESTGEDSFQCTKLNALFRAEQFEYENAGPIAEPTSSERQAMVNGPRLSIISPSSWSGVGNTNKEIEGILLQRLLWKVLAMATKNLHQGGSPLSLEEQFVQKQWDTMMTLQADEVQHRSDIQDLVFEYITCLLGEEYRLGPNFSGRIYDYSVSSSSVRMLHSIAGAEQPTTIPNSVREKLLCPVAMRVLYLFSETSDSNANESQGADTMKNSETAPPPEERVKYFKKQRKFLRKATPSWKTKGNYLSIKDAVKPIREKLRVSEAAPDVTIMSAMLAAENSRDENDYDLDYDQIWAFSKELPSYTKRRNFFSLKFYNGVLREDVVDPWEDSSEYESEGVENYTEYHDDVPITSDYADPRAPYPPSPGVPTPSQAGVDGPTPEHPNPEVGSGKIMPLPLIDFDPEKLEAEQTKKVKKWRVAKYYPDSSGPFPLPETGLIEALMGAQIQEDIDEWESKNNDGQPNAQREGEKVEHVKAFNLPTPQKPLWTVAPNYPIKIIPRSRGIGRARQVIPLVQLPTQPSTTQSKEAARSARVAEARKRRTRKEYKRRATPPPTTGRTQEPEPQLAREESQIPVISSTNTSNPITSPLPKPTVSIEEGENVLLEEYKPLSSKKLAKLMQLKKEKPLRTPQPSKGEGGKLRRFESSAEAAVTDSPPSSSPKYRLVGTGYHHLPANNELSSSTTVGQPGIAETTGGKDKRLVPVRVDATPRSLCGMIPVRPLYPWLPADRGRVQTPLKNLGVAFKERATQSEPRPSYRAKVRARKDKEGEFE
ncbi:hypothetical protein FQN54_003874 [Arachnomyces sp. PD_36]|nr:hypothetical protein FQN54_003874 [Arachnomyces sp. PD_36]